MSDSPKSINVGVGGMCRWQMLMYHPAPEHFTSLHCTAALHFPPPHCLPEQGHALPCHARRIPPIIADLSYHSRAITRWHVPGALHFTSFHFIYRSTCTHSHHDQRTPLKWRNTWPETAGTRMRISLCAVKTC